MPLDEMTPGKATFADDPEVALREYREQGFHVEPNVLSPDECLQHIAVAQALPESLNRSYRPIMNPHRLHPLFDQSLRSPHLISLIMRLIGTPLSALQSQFFYCAPGTHGFARHQDNFFVEAPEDGFVSAWIALTDISCEMGALVLYPGSHVHGRLPVQALPRLERPGQDPNAANEETLLPDGIVGLPMPVSRGSVVFLHSQLVHASLQNTSNVFRYALLQTYIRSGVSFRPGKTARRREIPL